MKSIYFLPVAALFILLFTACDDGEVLQKNPQKVELRYKSGEIIDADQSFGFELFREVFNQSDADNIMISPVSVSYALGMTLNGAAGATHDAFMNVLHFENLTDPEVNESYKDLMGQLSGLDDRVDLTLANSIWYKQEFEVLEEFIRTNKEYFDAAVEACDFNDPQTVDIINGWIEDHTNGKIRDMLDRIPSDAVMYLVNAIYFNAQWKYRFEEDKTAEGDFYLAGGTVQKADFMQVEGDFVRTYSDDFSAVELPYGDSAFSMVVVLPREDKSVADIVADLDAAHWQDWFANSSYGKVRIELPKFKYEFKDLLNVPLIDLGLGVTFSDQADFTRINPNGGLYISRVIHQSFIDVQEAGTEAAAATIVEIRETSAGGESYAFRADRPFLYVIKENSTGAILFMGSVGRPVYE